VTCDLPAEFLVPPAFARDDADVDRQAALAKRTADGCAASPTARLLPHITTRDVAMDLDRIRAALGERRISYLGFSFGAYLGAVYSTMFPQRTDRVVLDSNPGPGGLDYAWSRRFAEGFEQLFPDFARWLAANDAAYHQGSTPEAVRAKYFELAARFDEVPAGDLTGALFRWLTYSLVQSTASYGFLAQIWQAAEQGPVQRPPLPPGFDFSGLLALACNQGTWPTEVNTYRGAVNRDRERFPLFGAAAANVWACAFWPVTPDAPAVRITDRGPSNILMVQNIRDNGTAFSGALRTRAALGNRARMIAVDQGGHLAYLHGVNACANDLTSAYLAGGERPGDRVC
jgi:pimeloyl-ACP methyl ester carboxylesterase